MKANGVRPTEITSVTDLLTLHATVLATVIFALVSLAGVARAAGSCSDMALEIAMSSKLESGGLSKDGSFISLTGEPYGAYLYCSGPTGMSLRYVSPNLPSDDWYAFVSKTGSVLTKRPPPIVRSAVARCITEASKASDLVVIRSDGFDVLCDSEKGSPYFEVVVTQWLKQPVRGRKRRKRLPQPTP
jgi:hypothetical protein